MLLDDLADYLSSGGLGAVGTGIFKGFMPAEPVQDAVIVVYETGGQEPIRAMGPTAGSTVVVERPSVQVVCRGAAGDYASPRATAQAVFQLLEGLPTRTINGVAYKFGSARQQPFGFGRDDAGRVLVACNYDIVKAPG